MFNFLDFFIPIAEIAVITLSMYKFLSSFWKTRARDLILGMCLLYLLFLLTHFFNLMVLETLMLKVGNVAMIAILIIFQPEFRLTLSKLSFKRSARLYSAEFNSLLEQLSTSIYRLSERRIGALIVIERNDKLEEHLHSFVLTDAEFSSELLESLFVPTTPLHDGAIILRGKKIFSAATILPLSKDSSQLAPSMGTRHRAALGITECSDALGIVVSEGTGLVSITREGIITKGVKMDRLRGILRSIFIDPKEVEN